jgi:hypothetical protein
MLNKISRAKKMKIKLLFAPSIVVIIIIILIWQIYPTLTDPIGKSGVLEKMAELKKEKENLSAIQGKSEKVHELATELNSSSMSSGKTLVADFLPDSIKEYEIIDNLNYLVLKEELQGLDISVAQPEGSSALLTQADLSGNVNSPQAVEIKATTFKVNFSVLGSYEKIKDIFQKIDGLRRFNRVLDLKILQADPNSKDNYGNLRAVATLEFAYLKESGSFSSVDDVSIAKTEFDQEAMDNIAKKKDVPLLPDLQIDQKGKPNPFIP